MADTSPTRFQSFTATTQPDQGPPRVAKLREAMAKAGVDAFLIPRADAHQGEYVAPRDERLAWLTGFTGSAGFAAVTPQKAAVFADGRYTLQARAQTDALFEVVNWPANKLEDWLAENLLTGSIVAFDPWLHTMQEVQRLTRALAAKDITLRAVDNLVDAIWTDQPDPPVTKARNWPDSFAGQTAANKLKEMGGILAEAGQHIAVLTQPDSLCWLLNIRGGDVRNAPLLHGFAILDAKGGLRLYTDPEKLEGVCLPDQVKVFPPRAFPERLAQEPGPVRLDASSTPQAIATALGDTPIETGRDPCLLPKSRKSPAEITATKAAHLRDGAAVVRFLHWYDANCLSGITEIDCARAMEGFRLETGALLDLSFDTISGAGPNAALPHYRVNADSNRTLREGELYLIDSGGQYEDGTTDITRTLPVGVVGQTEQEAFTQVLRGMIAIHLARFPKGLAGRDLDALARAPLWAAGRDYDHGTGHGVGVYLGVHEGPQRLSRASTVPLEPGMILSNEPGYYREGQFGIRIENLIVVTEAEPLQGGDPREMLAFENLTWAPIDRQLIDTTQLSAVEIRWINTYHREVVARLRPMLDGEVASWLEEATAPL